MYIIFDITLYQELGANITLYQELGANITLYPELGANITRVKYENNYLHQAWVRNFTVPIHIPIHIKPYTTYVIHTN